MATLFFDCETFSEVPIANGTHAYAEGAKIILASYAWDDEPAVCVDMTDGSTTLDDLQDLMDRASVVVIHNSAFDRTILRNVGVNLPVEKVHDTMVQALSHSLPGALDKLCSVLHVPTNLAKDKDGKRLIFLFCKPQAANRKLRICDRTTHPADWEAFKSYARMDIEAMREVYKRLPKWNYAGPASNSRRDELELWHIDQRINDRGVAVDMELATAALRAVERLQARLAYEASELTEGHVGTTTQRDRVIAYLADYLGYPVEDLKGASVERILGDLGLSDEVRELLLNRQQAAATSPAKYKALLKGASKDGRLRGTLQFCGASRTGRFGGRVFQPQNLPRPVVKGWAVEEGIAAMKANTEDLLFNNVMDLITSAIRGCIVAPAGRKLVIADLSNIEGRMLAWLAGETWKLEAFAAFDRGVGHDLYKITAASILHKKPEDITKDERQVSGKVPELACLGPDTMVLTDRGPVVIVEVGLNDQLWDGVEWVKHEGVISRGQRSVLDVHGIEMTGDHEILCVSRWLSAQTVVSNPVWKDLALATGSANLPFLDTSLAPKAASEQLRLRVPAAENHTGSSFPICVKELQPVAMFAPSGRGIRTRNCGSATPTSFPTMSIADGSAIEFRLATTGATIQKTPDTQTMVAEVFRFTRRGARTEQPFWRTYGNLTDGTNLFWNWIAPTWTKVTSPVTYGLSPSSSTLPTKEKSQSFKPELQNLKPVYDIARAGPRSRFTVLTPSGQGLIVHNCGYQGALGAFKTMGALYGVDLPDNTVLGIVKAWRGAHPNTVKLWYGLENACRDAVHSPGVVKRVGKLAIQRDGVWLRIRLPSGRYLCYPGIECDDAGKLSYLGVNQYTRKWERLRTYGGKLVENVTQAASRDVLCYGMKLAEESGYPVVLHVHDELLCEVPDTTDYNVARLSAIMSTNPPWAEGLPLAAAGFETYRYRKED